MSESLIWPYPGSRWWKFDFHTHTPASKDTHDWQRAKGTDDEVTPEKWLLRFMAAGLDCVAVTDHNSGVWIDELKQAYQRLTSSRPAGFRELVIFPGVELSVTGFHLLVLLDPAKGTAQICSLLGAVGFPDDLHGETDAQDRAACAAKAPLEVIEIVNRLGALAIPAHVEDNKGLLQVVGDDRRCVLPIDFLKQVRASELLALEVRELDAPRANLMDGLTHIVGTDCHNFRGPNQPGDAFTWVKMGLPTLEGLKLALLDGNEVSVRRYDDATEFDALATPENFLVSLTVENARYMGLGGATELAFSPYLNAIIGGRGTGKSTVVHALRLGLRKENELLGLEESSEARETFERFNRIVKGRTGLGGLREGTEISVILSRDGILHRIRWSSGGQKVEVDEQADGEWKPSSSSTVSSERFPVRLFSQGQIAALAGRDQRALLELLDEAAGVPELLRQLIQEKSRYLELCQQASGLERQLGSLDRETRALGDVQRKLERFEKTDHADTLKAYQRASRQKRELGRQHQHLVQLAERLMLQADELYAEEPPELLFDSAVDGEASSAVEDWALTVNTAREAVRRAGEELRSRADEIKVGLKEGAWFAQLTDVETRYASLRTELNAHGVTDPSEFGKLVQDRQRLETEIRRLQSLLRRQEELGAQAEQQLGAVLRARRAVTQARANFLGEALAQNLYVRIRVVPYGREPLVIERELRQLLDIRDGKYESDILEINEDGIPVRGAVAGLLKGATVGPSAGEEAESRIASVKEQLHKACEGEPGRFGGRFAKSLKQMSERRPEFACEIACWFPEDSLSVEYSSGGDGKGFRPIEEGSAGQRAAAMLAFLLTQGDEPIVLDQPEDDLDNHLIYDLVVRQIRASKSRRQLIIVTHNPNIVVNGDADMVYAMDFKRGQCVVSTKGSLQELSVRQEVCRVMEGGQEAFSRRYRRLGPGALPRV